MVRLAIENLFRLNSFPGWSTFHSIFIFEVAFSLLSTSLWFGKLPSRWCWNAVVLTSQRLEFAEKGQLISANTNDLNHTVSMSWCYAIVLMIDVYLDALTWDDYYNQTMGNNQFVRVCFQISLHLPFQTISNNPNLTACSSRRITLDSISGVKASIK